MCFYSTFFSGIVLPALYIKTSSSFFFFPVFLFCLWELRFKSLTNVFVCWTVEMTRLSTDVAQELCCLAASGSFYIVLWDLTVFPTGQGYLGLRALTPTPPKKNKTKKKTSQSNQSITCNRRVIFYTEVRSNVCVIFQKKQYLVVRRLYC